MGPRKYWHSEKVPLQCTAIPEMVARLLVAKMLRKDSGLGRSACGQLKRATYVGAPSSIGGGCSRLPTASGGK